MEQHGGRVATRKGQLTRRHVVQNRADRDDVRARIGYMRACFRGYDDWYLGVSDAFAPWREMIERFDEGSPEAVLI